MNTHHVYPIKRSMGNGFTLSDALKNLNDELKSLIGKKDFIISRDAVIVHIPERYWDSVYAITHRRERGQACELYPFLDANHLFIGWPGATVKFVEDLDIPLKVNDVPSDWAPIDCSNKVKWDYTNSWVESKLKEKESEIMTLKQQLKEMTELKDGYRTLYEFYRKD